MAHSRKCLLAFFSITIQRLTSTTVMVEIFHKVTSLYCTAFNALVKELLGKIILVIGCSIQVQEQVLLFIDIVINNNAMSQMAIKFQGGLFTVQR
ncbi:hypothetical protein VP01_204g8 [Puccinia sorghi]|uniref:Uncharacterized protein n=1 Tax=Puccinia sorghi TaxID=27349 RepID=A0A0L6VAX9_9BASI|nr:hypothetical protein VP01_204g8 [Puccinia sorghi]